MDGHTEPAGVWRRKGTHEIYELERCGCGDGGEESGARARPHDEGGSRSAHRSAVCHSGQRSVRRLGRLAVHAKCTARARAARLCVSVDDYLLERGQRQRHTCGTADFEAGIVVAARRAAASAGGAAACGALAEEAAGPWAACWAAPKSGGGRAEAEGEAGGDVTADARAGDSVSKRITLSNITFSIQAVGIS